MVERQEVGGQILGLLGGDYGHTRLRVLRRQSDGLLSGQRRALTYRKQKWKGRHDGSWRVRAWLVEMAQLPVFARLPCSNVEEVGPGAARAEQMRLVESVVSPPRRPAPTRGVFRGLP